MDVHNTTVFVQNIVTGLNGALYLESFGQLRVFPQTNLFFDRNSGRFNLLKKFPLQYKFNVHVISLLLAL